MALTGKQLKFAEEYIIDFNATQAAIRAGYSERTASTSGYRNIKNDEVQAKITEFQEAARNRLQQRFSSDAVEARKIMFDIMKDADSPPAVRLNAVKDFLDRAGFKPVDKVDSSIKADVNLGQNPYNELTADELRKLIDSG